jgi:hypothetical protein
LVEGASQDHSPKFDAVVNWNQTHLRPAPAAPTPAP